MCRREKSREETAQNLQREKERERGIKEDQRTSRAVLSLYFTFRDLVSDDVYRDKWNRARARGN